MTAAVEAVCFDLDDTLCEYRRTQRELLDSAFEAVGVEPLFTAAEYVRAYEELVDDSADMLDLRERCFASLAADAGRDPATGRAVARAYADERDHGNVRVLPGAREAVETLAGEYRLALVTNGAPGMQRQKIDALGFGDAFESVVFGGYDAPAKPAPDPFYRALDDVDVAPDRAVHVGNSLSSDVAGARAAGLASVWLDDGSRPDPEPTYAIDSLFELTEPPWR